MADIPQRFYDRELQLLINQNINLTVPLYIMASYAYYVEDDPILMDQTFDELALIMRKNWDKIEHFHKDYITFEELQATTYLGDYPRRAINSLLDIRKNGMDF